MRHALSRLFVVAAVLVTLLPAGAFASTRYFCKMMDRVTASECCCAKQRLTPSHAVDDAIQAEGCCERLQRADSTLPSSTRPTPLDNPSYGVAATLPALQLDAPDARSGVAATPGAARAPPLFGPPLFLKHCVLLT